MAYYETLREKKMGEEPPPPHKSAEEGPPSVSNMWHRGPLRCVAVRYIVLASSDFLITLWNRMRGSKIFYNKFNR